MYELTRFVDYILYNNVVKIGIIMNSRSNSLIPSKRIMNDVSFVRTFISDSHLLHLFDIPYILFFIATIGFFSPVNLSICILFIFIVVAVLVKKNSIIKEQNKTGNAEKAQSLFYENMFNNYKYIYSNIKIDNIAQKYSSYDEERYKLSQDTRYKINNINFFSKIVLSFCQVIIFANSILLYVNNKFSIGAFMLTIILTNQSLQKLNVGLNAIIPLLQVNKAIARISVAIKNVDVFDLSNKNIIRNDKNTTNITLDNVSYVNDSLFPVRTTVNNLSMQLQGGSIYLIQITNGNKTNINDLLNLISGQIYANRGKITIYISNNGDSDIVFCPCEPVNMYGSIVDIITGYSEDVNMIKFNNIVNITGLTDLINSLKNGFYTQIGANSNFSADFIKRVNIATALYSNANVIILDEPFVFIDKTTEHRIIDFLEQLAKLGKIVIITSQAECLSEEYGIKLVRF